MTIHVALLRGINVGGKNKIAMADLRQAMESMGFSGVQSVLQSGNLVFRSGQLKGPALERHLEAESAKRLKLPVDYVVRSAKEWAKIIASNPFPDEAKNDPSHLVVLCLKAKPPAGKVKTLEAAAKGGELIQAVGQQLYIAYKAGIADSKLTSALFDQRLGISGTGRNWNTVLKLKTMIDGIEDNSGR